MTMLRAIIAAADAAADLTRARAGGPSTDLVDVWRAEEQLDANLTALTAQEQTMSAIPPHGITSIPKTPSRDDQAGSLPPRPAPVPEPRDQTFPKATEPQRKPLPPNNGADPNQHARLQYPPTD
ncbi:MAG TPA: hypothetical protein VIS06_18420 [Mycobacteriales bacterium]